MRLLACLTVWTLLASSCDPAVRYDCQEDEDCDDGDRCDFSFTIPTCVARDGGTTSSDAGAD